MPSPAGHLLAGVAIAWAAEAVGLLRPRSHAAGRQDATARVMTPLALACAALAIAPDLDILLLASHRTVTHSLAAVGAATVVCGLVARALGAPGLANGLVCGLAVASHVALDWLGRDSSTPRGIMVFWPVSMAHYCSGLDLFSDISRRYWKPDEFILKNTVAVARELLILGPFAALAWRWRGRSAANRRGNPGVWRRRAASARPDERLGPAR